MSYEEHEIIYDVKTAIFRIGSILLIFLLIWFLVVQIGENNNLNNNSENILSQIFTLELKPIEDNSRGEFHSVNKNIFAEGYANIVEKNNETFLVFTSFKITNNPNLEIFLSVSTTGKARVKISNLVGNIGEKEFIISQDLDISKFNYLVILDSTVNKTLVYVETKDLFN